MAATHDLGDFTIRLQNVERGLNEFAKRFLVKADVRIGAAAVGRMAPGPSGPPKRDRLTIRSGRLARSLTGNRGAQGQSGEGYSRVETVSSTLVKLIKGTKVPYAAVHEHGFYGSRLAHTRRVRGRTVAVRSYTLRIAQRAYLHPAVQQELPALQKMAEADLKTFLVNALS